MGRKRRIVRNHVDKPVSSTSTDATPSRRERHGDEQSAEGSTEEEEDGVIPLETILSQQGPDKEYLRLRNLRGHLPLSFYTHPDIQSVRILNLRNCRIHSLAPQISLLTQLRHIDVSGNHGVQLPSSLARCNLTRFLYSPSLLEAVDNHNAPYSTVLNREYCGDKKAHRLPTLTRLAAQYIIQTYSLDELEEIRAEVPHHLRDLLTPQVCAECGSLGRKMVATRIRRAVVAFQTVPLHYTLCSPTCLQRIQEVWKLEELLNDEKRALRLQKFGQTSEIRYSMASYAYA